MTHDFITAPAISALGRGHSTRSSRITLARFSPEVCPRTVSPTRATVMAGARSAARDSRWLLLVCFVSGAAALIFEMVWFHRSGLVFGNSVWATSLVLSSFMGGLTIGSAIVGRSGHRVRRFLRAYAATEVVVA